jgi:hypothetical protein
MANYIKNTTHEGLGTLTVTIPTTDLYMIQGTITHPNLVPTPVAGPGGGAGTGTSPNGTVEVPSQVVLTINQNGSPVYTSQAGAQGFNIAALNCAAGDLITFVRTSSLPQDEQLNAVRMTLSISEGVN